MLRLRPNCECCNKDLPPKSADAMICSFECTFCRDCTETTVGGRCPNCRRRVGRPSYPSGREAGKVSGVHRPHGQAGRLRARHAA